MDVPVEQALALTAPEQYQFPVSFAQQRLWFLDQLEGPSPVYNVKLPVRLTGALDTGVLQRAVDRLVARHESLRTTFRVERGEPVQVVHSQMSIAVQPIDLSGADPETVRYRVAELADHDFQLDRGPLLEVYLLRLAAEEHLLLLLTHHIVSDAWSTSVMFRDLAAIYGAMLVGDAASLPELSIQYADFAVWQQDWLTGPDLEQQVEFWRDNLHGAPPFLELPADRPRPARQTYRGSRISRGIPVGLTSELKALASRERCTLFMVLLAGGSGRPAGALFRTAGHRGRISYCRSSSLRAGGPRRAICQYAGLAQRSIRKSFVPRLAATCASHVSRCVCSPGSAL